MELIDFIFPKKCLECGRQSKYICLSCLKKLPQVKQKCPYCEKASVDGVTHIKCSKIFGINGIYYLWPYQGVIRKAVLNLKFNFAKQIAQELSQYMVFFLKKQEIFPKDSILTIIPLQHFRKNFRGFNQSEIIARNLCKKMDWIIMESLLKRSFLYKSQMELKEKDRKKNIMGVFTLKPGFRPLASNYIIFDDICTTGSTLKEAAKVLKRNGVKAVWGLTVAG